MKNLMFLFVCVACLLTNAAACTTSDNPQPDQTITVWDRYNVGSVLFEDKAPETAGSDIYRRIIPQPESYIKEQARTVLATLYTSPKDSIPRVETVTSASSTAPVTLNSRSVRTTRPRCCSKPAAYCSTN